MSGRSRTHRRAIALVTCVLWLLAVELLPSLHLAAHADDHTHASDGRIVRVARVVLDDHDEDAGHAHDHARGRAHAHRTHADAHHSELALAERTAPPTEAEAEAEPALEPAHTHPRRPRRAQLAIDDAGAAHAATGIAHHQLALHRPPPPLVAPVAVDRVAWPLGFALADRRADLALARPAARGPPRA